MWNLNNGTCKHVLEGHKGRLNQVAVSDDGELAVTASDDGTARLWDLATGACKKVLQVGSYLALQECNVHGANRTRGTVASAAGRWAAGPGVGAIGAARSYARC